MTDNVPQANNSSMMPSQNEFQMLQVIAKNAQDSGLYAGVGQQAKILMVLLAARELGISPMLALNGGIWNISGKIEISARLMNGLIRRAGHSIKIVVSDDIKCTLLGTRNDGDSFECSFTMEDATKAGLAGGNVWKKYPADMLYNRCMSRLARRLFSDVIGNAYVEGEIREAKLVEDKEKNLPTIEYEDITAKEEKIEPENKVSSILTEPKISEDQLNKILEGMLNVDESFITNYSTYMRDKWSVSEYKELPLRAYNPTMTAIQRNIEMNANKAGQNANH